MANYRGTDELEDDDYQSIDINVETPREDIGDEEFGKSAALGQSSPAERVSRLEEASREIKVEKSPS